MRVSSADIGYERATTKSRANRKGRPRRLQDKLLRSRPWKDAHVAKCAVDMLFRYSLWHSMRYRTLSSLKGRESLS